MLNTQTIVVIAVSDTDSARFAFAIWLNRFDEVPPGQAAKIIIPIAIAGGALKFMANNNAIIGRSISWPDNPNSIGLGAFNKRVKSLGTKLKPIPNIINASAPGSSSDVTIEFSISLCISRL